MITIATACQNRNENLLKVIRSWLASRYVSEIMISDFGSSYPVEQTLKDHGIYDERIFVERTPAPIPWVLSWAYNRVLRISSGKIVAKIDCDNYLTDTFFNDMLTYKDKIDSGVVFAGNWMESKADASKPKGLSGVFVASQESIEKIGGFNPFILTYGWDDIDLYERFTIAGLEKHDAPSKWIQEIYHSEKESVIGQIFGNNAITSSDTVNYKEIREVSNTVNSIISRLTRPLMASPKKWFWAPPTAAFRSRVGSVLRTAPWEQIIVATSGHLGISPIRTKLIISGFAYGEYMSGAS